MDVESSLLLLHIARFYRYKGEFFFYINVQLCRILYYQTNFKYRATVVRLLII